MVEIKFPADKTFVPALEGMLVDNGKRARRERLTYQRMFEELKAAALANEVRWLAFVNPDAVVKEGALALLVSYLTRHPRAADPSR